VDPARFRPIRDPARIEAVRARYGLPRRFLLFVGAISPRKNLPLLLAAHARLAGRRPSPDIVLVGPATRWGDAGARHHAGVRVVGFVEPEDLPAVYSAAELLVYPSLHEGFGLPIVEAMACGLPVVCTRAADPDELAADAAVYVSGHDADELAQAIEHLDDGPRRERAIAAGLEQARRLSWQRCAEETRAVYQAAFRAHARTIQDG
jgi:alpha-1,3-rhamnosyl/mannosyltransferase